eukprot:15451874-Alexandrium_andersonii.AAC.1
MYEEEFDACPPALVIPQEPGDERGKLVAGSGGGGDKEKGGKKKAADKQLKWRRGCVRCPKRSAARRSSASRTRGASCSSRRLPTRTSKQ